MPTDLFDLIAAVFSIVLIDLVLSGDNAVVIGLAARSLPARQQRLAIIFGGLGAILLRILFAVIAAYLLGIPLLQAVGGVLLLWIAWKLLHEESGPHEVAEGKTLHGALQTIILADVVMSLDNILAIAGVSHGNVFQLAFGLFLSMPIILFGSSLIATLMNRLPWLVFVGSGILTWTAGGMIEHDRIVGRLLPSVLVQWHVIPILLTVIIVLPSIIEALQRRQPAAAPVESHRLR